MKTTTMIVAAMLCVGTAVAKDITTDIAVKGMTCGSCAVSVKTALTKVPGVKSADVSVEKAQAKVVYDDNRVNEKQLREAINKTGFKAEETQEKH